MSILTQNLEHLNDWLKSVGKHIDLHVIGGHAIIWHQIDTARITHDIDSVKEIVDAEIIGKIHEIGEASGEAEWFDFGADNLYLPDGYQQRLVKIKGLCNIDIYLLSLKDIVVLKVAAYFSRREQGIERDFEDLLKIGPSFSDVCDGIDFILKKQGADMPTKFLNQLKNELKAYKNELAKHFKN